MDLKDYLQGMFTDHVWHVRNPHYKGDIKLNWPSFKGAPSTVVCLGVNGTEDLTQEQFNDRVSFRNLTPINVNVNTKLWLRGDNDENGNIIYTVGFYYTLDTMEF